MTDELFPGQKIRGVFVFRLPDGSGWGWRQNASNLERGTFVSEVDAWLDAGQFYGILSTYNRPAHLLTTRPDATSGHTKILARDASLQIPPLIAPLSAEEAARDALRADPCPDGWGGTWTPAASPRERGRQPTADETRADIAMRRLQHERDDAHFTVWLLALVSLALLVAALWGWLR